MVSSVSPLCPKKLEENELVLSNACGSSENDDSNCPIHCQPKQDNQDNGKKIPILWKSRIIPSKKRTPKVYKRLTPMQMFHRQLLREYRRQNNSSSEEVLMIHDMHNSIRNEIGLGCIVLKPDSNST
ncbi:unnamed protein product [Trifolium pratense]|uniref:Uncharacterized protein n=1 Tax=Trifolium pratense TaxID=57577 RepID=A0ACB0KGK6_TRIPR|nr:unnamed protein product [Trifolium pratense]